MASLEMLMRRASNKTRRTFEVEIKSLDNTIIKVQEPTDDLIMDSAEMGEDGYAYMLSELLVEPNIKDAQLLADMKKEDSSINGYLDIVKKLFRKSEISAVCNGVLAQSGYSEDNIKVLKKQ